MADEYSRAFSKMLKNIALIEHSRHRSFNNPAYRK